MTATRTAPAAVARGEGQKISNRADGDPLPTVAADTDRNLASLTALPLPWAVALIRSAEGPAPEYGSPAWAALPNESRVKVAACVIAAEAWRTRHYRDDYMPAQGSRRAREIAEARRSRPRDYMGGPVQWDEVGGQ